MDDRMISVCYRLSAVTRGVMKQLQDAIEKENITAGQAMLMKSIAEHCGIAQNELAGTVFRDASTVTGILKALEAKGLLERVPDAADRRIRRLYLTAEGIRKSKTVTERLQSIGEKYTSGLQEDDILALERISATLLQIHEGQEGTVHA